MWMAAKPQVGFWMRAAPSGPSRPPSHDFARRGPPKKPIDGVDRIGRLLRSEAGGTTTPTCGAPSVAPPGRAASRRPGTRRPPRRRWSAGRPAWRWRPGWSLHRRQQPDADPRNSTGTKAATAACSAVSTQPKATPAVTNQGPGPGCWWGRRRSRQRWPASSAAGSGTRQGCPLWSWAAVTPDPGYSCLLATIPHSSLTSQSSRTPEACGAPRRSPGSLVTASSSATTSDRRPAPAWEG